jgi:hypothetical protein
MIFYFVLSGQLAISYAYAYPPLFTYYPDRKVQTIKDLEKPWAALTPRVLRPAPPALQSTPSSPKWTGHSAATTLLLDDSHAKAALQPHNHLCIPEYTRTQRNADLAVLQLEHALQQQHSSTVSHQEGSSSATRDATTNTRSHERAVSSPDGTSTSTEIEQADNKRKRKKTKKKKDKAQPQTLHQLAAIAAAAADGGASPAPAPAAVLDETLLAVIGILHAARLQCSIAGWLRARALFHPPPPPPLSEPRRAAAAGVMGDGGGGGGGNAARTWCDDPVLVRAWASRGREAMHELGLKVEHGVES